MPMYDYTCTTCHTVTELIVELSKRDSQVCSMCGSRMIREMPLCARMSFNWSFWNPKEALGKVEGVREAVNGRGYLTGKEDQD